MLFYCHRRFLYTLIALVATFLFFIALNKYYSKEKSYSLWCLSASSISFLLFIYDKIMSKLSTKNRIPELTFCCLTILGASYGTLAGMILFVHKTRKIKFWICVALSLALQFYRLQQPLFN
jgi:uncharacterized membrane protein YsdA (DUF1294 family)